MPIVDPVIQYPQTTYPNVLEPLSLGERWGHCLHPDLESVRLPLPTAVLVSAAVVFTTAFDGGAGWVKIDGAKYELAVADDAAAVAALSAIPAFAANFTASTPGANQLRIEALDTKSHTFEGDGVQVVGIASSVTPTGDLYARTGYFVCSDSLLSTAKIPTSMDDTPLGVVCAEGLPSAFEREARGVPKGVLGFPPAYGFLVAVRGEKRVVPVSSDCAMDGIAWAVMTGVNAGTFRKDNGGTSQVSELTVTPDAGQLVGFHFDSLPTLEVTSVNLATDNAALCDAFNANAQYKALGTASVAAGKISIAWSDNAVHTFTDDSANAPKIAHVVTQAATAAIAKQTGTPGGGPLVVFKQASATAGRVFATVG